MNARQTKKRLKKQIDKLQSDNDLMRRIISNTPQMQELYDLYNKPVNYTLAHMQFEEYRSEAFVPPSRLHDDEFIALLKRELIKKLSDAVKDYITYKFDFHCINPTITASILVGRK